VGKRMLSFSKSDAVSDKERSDAEKYGTGLDEFFKKTAKEQIEAPDVVNQPGYTGGSEAEGKEGEEAKEGEEGKEDETKEVKYEDIGEGLAMVDYDNLNPTAAKQTINRAKLLKADARLADLEVKVTKTKTKKAIIVEVTADRKKDLIKSFKAELKELVRNGATGTNYYNYVQSITSGSVFKVIRETPAVSRGGGATSAAPTPAPTPSPPLPSASTSASRAVTTALEGSGAEGEWEVAGEKKRKVLKSKAKVGGMGSGMG
jgi:hypothetical protein